MSWSSRTIALSIALVSASGVAQPDGSEPGSRMTTAEATESLVLQVEARPFVHANNVPYGISGATVTVGDASCTTDASGACTISGLEPGPATVEMTVPRCADQAEELELAGGLHEIVTFVDSNACPEGMACIVQSNAYLELHVAGVGERERLGAYVAGVVGLDGSVVAMEAGPWSTQVVDFEVGGSTFSLRFTRTPGAFGDRVEPDVIGADGTRVLEGVLWGYDETTAPGCETICASPGAGFVAIHFAHSWLGDPLEFCEPPSCDGD